MLPPSSRLFQIAHQIAFLGFHDVIDGLVGTGEFSQQGGAGADAGGAGQLLRRRRADALPAVPRRGAATRYDVDILKNRFGVSFEQVCHRLTTLRRPGAEGVPFHFIRVDIAGNISKRFSASGIHIARFGAACPRWNVYDAFGTPGMLRVQVSQMPDGKSYFCIARRPAGPSLHRDQPAAAPHRPARRRPRLRHPPCERDRLRRRAQSRRPANRHADRRLLPHLPAHRLRRARHAVLAPAPADRRERARLVDLRRGLTTAPARLGTPCRLSELCLSPWAGGQPRGRMIDRVGVLRRRGRMFARMARKKSDWPNPWSIVRRGGSSRGRSAGCHRDAPGAVLRAAAGAQRPKRRA